MVHARLVLVSTVDDRRRPCAAGQADAVLLGGEISNALCSDFTSVLHPYYRSMRLQT
jgi:hypothetical protein